MFIPASVALSIQLHFRTLSNYPLMTVNYKILSLYRSTLLSTPLWEKVDIPTLISEGLHEGVQVGLRSRERRVSKP